MNATTPKEVKVTLYLPDHAAIALAQFVKRIGASLALAALESCADITDIVEARELLAAARGEVA